MRGRILVVVAGCTAGCSLLVDTSGLSDGDRTSSGDASTAATDGGTARDSAALDGGADGTDPVDAGSALVGDWPFDEGTGTTAMDLSGHGHHALALGGQWTADRGGVAGHAFLLDGSPTSYLSSPGHADFDRSAGARLTMMAWVRFDDVPSHAVFVSVSYGDKEAAYGIEMHGPTALNYWDGSGHIAEATVPDVVGAWHHAGVVVDGPEARVYFDGVRVAQGAADATPRRATQLMLGRSNYGNGLKGALDGVRFFRAALTDAEMLAEKNR